MENNLKNIINKYKAKKITLKNSAKIIENENTRLVIKKDNPNILDTYNYLLSRSFDYFPKIIYKDNDYNVYEYVEDVNEPSEQRILDIITLTSILHSKTTFYKEVDIDNYKYLYETINKKLEYLFNYYNDIITLIEKNIYMSPSNYIIARNINKIFETINYCKYEVDSWYELIKDKGNCFNLDELEEKFTDYFDEYDYVFADYAYDKIRLKGFFDSHNKKAT